MYNRNAYRRMVAPSVASNKLLNLTTISSFFLYTTGLLFPATNIPTGIALFTLIASGIPSLLSLPFRDKIQKDRNEIATDIFHAIQNDGSIQKYFLYLRPFITSGNLAMQQRLQDANVIPPESLYPASTRFTSVLGEELRGDMELQFADTFWSAGLPFITLLEVKIVEVNHKYEVVLNAQKTRILEIDDQGQIKRLKISEKGELSTYEKHELVNIRTKVFQRNEQGQIISLKVYEEGQGAGRIQEEFGDDWLVHVSNLARNAQGIIVTLVNDGGVNRNGTIQEIEMLKNQNFLDKTIFFVPALTDDSIDENFQANWQQTRYVLNYIGIYLPNYQSDDFVGNRGYFLKYLERNNILVEIPIDSFRQMYFPWEKTNPLNNTIDSIILRNLININTYDFNNLIGNYMKLSLGKNITIKVKVYR